jgi:hypothetical protein
VKKEALESLLAVINSKANVSNWLTEESYNYHWLDVNKDTLAEVILGLSNDK